MRQILLSTLVLCVPVLFQAQTVSDYNPDANGDNLIDVQDLLAILGLFGSEWGDSATGCTYPNACNYNPLATADDGSCLFVVDALGQCGGDCPADEDGDGICDTVDDCVGVYDACGVCNGDGPVLACGCDPIPEGDCDCEGNQLDEYGVCGGDGTPPEHWVTFRVDMSEYAAPYSTVYLSGGFNSWCGNCTPMFDEDGDGVWSRSVLLAAGEQQFKFTLDDWDQNESFDAGAPCTVTNFEFTNRVVEVNGDLQLPEYCWNSCSDCQEEEACGAVCAEAAGRAEPVTFDGYQMQLGGVPFHIKGVAWSPIPLGSGPGFLPDNHWALAVSEDADLMEEAGINVVRTYGPIEDPAVLDTLYAHGIHVLMTVYYGYNDTPELAASRVCALKSHPAIIGWVVGNEWNLFDADIAPTFSQVVATINTVAATIQANDDTRPVSTVWGGYLPPQGIVDDMPDIDFWGLNVYTGASFNTQFDEWEALTGKPFYYAEYGADAYDGTAGQVDEATQADLIEAQTLELYANASVNGSGPCAGGVLFEFNDEWWKADGNWNVHDTANPWYNAAYPDPNMHEEWWGIVDIFRVPRQAYYTYAGLEAPQ